MKSLQIIIFQALLLLLIACGQSRPRVIQQEGFTLIYDTLNVDVSKVISTDKSLRLQFALPLDGGYLCAFEQEGQWRSRDICFGQTQKRVKLILLISLTKIIFLGVLRQGTGRFI